MRRLITFIAAVAVLSAAAFDGGEEIRVVSGIDSVVVGGSFARGGASPWAALVMVTGSGQQTRDEEVGGHKLFYDIASRLDSAGIATIRLDDRGIGASGGDYASIRYRHMFSDIEAALDSLRKRCPDIPIGVLGHSEGGYIAVRTAAEGRCDFIVTLAAAAWPGDSVIMSQGRALATALTGRWDGEPLQRRILDAVGSDLPDVLLRSVLTVIISEAYGAAAGQFAGEIGRSVDALTTPHYREMVKLNPRSDMVLVSRPWLALNGDRDCQVLPANLQTIGELNPNADTLLLPAHNHLFQKCSSGLVNEYASLGTVSYQTTDAIIDWLRQLCEK